jgi:hypothetical protein
VIFLAIFKLNIIACITLETNIPAYIFKGERVLFEKTGYIDWRQGKIKYEIGDIIYIYITSPIKK